MKVLIAVPCLDQVAAPFAQCLATVRKVEETGIILAAGSLVYDSRNQLAACAVDEGIDYVMWFDSDMTFPADTIEKMLKHMEAGKDIVSGLYFKRRPPYTPVLYSDIGTQDDVRIKSIVDYPSDELFEVAACGFGCVMVRTKVFADVFDKYKGYFSPIDSYGEDLSFCIRAAGAGYKIFCDPTIKCGHVGCAIYTEEFYKGYKEQFKEVNRDVK